MRLQIRTYLFEGARHARLQIQRVKPVKEQ
jgi:hypothetical protein